MADENDPWEPDRGPAADPWDVLVHDLRTPAAVALGHTQLLLRRLKAGGEVDPARTATTLLMVERALGRLLARLAIAAPMVEPVGRRRFLGGRLAAARRKAGLSQRSLAAAAGLSHGTVARLERGEGQAPRLATIHRMAEVLGVAPDDLIAWDDGGERG